MKKLFGICFLFIFAISIDAAEPIKNVPQYLQDISVTIHAGNAQGSGAITNIGNVNYVWTAGHVIENLRKTRTIIDPILGTSKTLIEFDDVEIVKDLLEEGRTVGQIRFFAQVLRYSDAEVGDDLAVLKVRKKNLSPIVVRFYLDKEIPLLGSELYHVGSLLGQVGSNSMTRGIMSQHGRLLFGKVFDQTTCAAFPGSSGGGVYLTDGRYVGMIVRGAGETFNLTVPIRRMREWAKRMGVEFTLDPSLKVPTEEELNRFPIENDNNSNR